MIKKYWFLLIIIPLVVWVTYDKKIEDISSFEECAQAGYPIMESYPEQCRSKDGQLFVRDIGNELEKTDLIIVNSPRPGEVVTSPLTISGEARGLWFFEADFPIELQDNNGQVIASTIATALTDWMTEDFVAFSAQLDFQTGLSSGQLILKKDNPSGLDADHLRIPVVFQ